MMINAATYFWSFFFGLFMIDVHLTTVQPPLLGKLFSYFCSGRVIPLVATFSVSSIIFLGTYSGIILYTLNTVTSFFYKLLSLKAWINTTSFMNWRYTFNSQYWTLWQHTIHNKDKFDDYIAEFFFFCQKKKKNQVNRHWLSGKIFLHRFFPFSGFVVIILICPFLFVISEIGRVSFGKCVNQVTFGTPLKKSFPKCTYGFEKQESLNELSYLQFHLQRYQLSCNIERLLGKTQKCNGW